MNRLTALFALASSVASSLSGCATLDSATCSTDVKIRTSVQSSLDARGDLGAPNSIHVQSIDRVVYLSGLVDTGPEKWIAESVAAHTPGVTHVVNSIEQNN